MDDIVERVARAALKVLIDMAGQDSTVVMPAMARAIIPLVLEHAAKVAENEAAQGSYRAGERIAGAIRAIGAP